MRNVLILTRRELSSYFVSPIAYVAMALFLAATGFVFAFLGTFSSGQPAHMGNVFFAITFILVLVIPILTMRSFAEERGSGTLETLMTAPVTDVEVVLGKFFGCWAMYLVMLAPTAIYVALLASYGDPDYGPVLSGYLGLALLGALYVAVGVLASSMTRNQVIAAVVGFAILALLAWISQLVAVLTPAPYRTIARIVSVPTHYTDFSQGVVDLVQVVYFVALTLYVLFFTVKILESRRWR